MDDAKTVIMEVERDMASHGGEVRVVVQFQDANRQLRGLKYKLSMKHWRR